MDERGSSKKSIKRAKSSEGCIVKSRKKKKTTKKKPVVVLTTFFEHRKNSQGFPMHQCRYQKEVNDHMYVPKNYGELSRGMAWRNLSFCTSCKLEPCIMVEHFEDVFEKAMVELKVQSQKIAAGKKCTDLATIQKIEKVPIRFLTKYFGKEYMARHGIPNCVLKGTHEYTQEWYNS